MWHEEGSVLRLGKWEYVLRDSGSHWEEEKYWQDGDGAAVVEMVKVSLLRQQKRERKREKEIECIEKKNAEIWPVYSELKRKVDRCKEELAKHKWYMLAKQKREEMKELKAELDELEQQRQKVWMEVDHFPHRIAIYIPCTHLYHEAPKGEYDPEQDCVWIQTPRQWKCLRCGTELDYPEKEVHQCLGCQLWQVWWMEPLQRDAVYAERPELVWAGYIWKQFFDKLDMYLCLDEEWGAEHDKALLEKLSSMGWRWCEVQWFAQLGKGLV